MSLRVYRHVGAFGEVLSEQAISALIGTPLPWALRITEVDIDVGRQAEPAMVREFLAPVPGQGLVELGRQLDRLLACLLSADTTVRVSLLATFTNIT